jgi:hypothetical protein
VRRVEIREGRSREAPPYPDLWPISESRPPVVASGYRGTAGTALISDCGSPYINQMDT